MWTSSSAMGDLTHFRVFKIVRRPLHAAFVYVFHHTYVQVTDVYTYLSTAGKTSYFRPEDVAAMAEEKRPAKYPLPLLYKVIQTCCGPSLAATSDPVWTDANPEHEERMEQALSNLLYVYKEALSGHLTQPKDLKDWVGTVKLNIERLMKGAGQHDSSGRWREDLARVLNHVDAIIDGAWDCLAIGDDIQDELAFRSQQLSLAYNKAPLDGSRLKLSELLEHQPTTPSIQNGGIVVPAIEIIGRNDNIITPKSENNRVIIIYGEAGSGRTSLLASLAASYTHRDYTYHGVAEYDTVLIAWGGDTSPAGDLTVGMFQVCLPCCCQMHSPEAVIKWIVASRVLLIIDDAELLCDANLENLSKMVSVFPECDMVLLTCPTQYEKVKRMLEGHKCRSLILQGFGKEEIVTATGQLMQDIQASENASKLISHLEKNMCRLHSVMKYPAVILDVCNLCASEPHSLEKISTSTDLLWALLWFKVRQTFNVTDLDKNLKQQVLEWLLFAGQTALLCLKSGLRLEHQDMIEVVTEAERLLTSEKGSCLVGFSFKPSLQKKADVQEYRSVHIAQEQFLSAWYLLNQAKRNRPLESLVTGINCFKMVMIYMAGLIEKVRKEEGFLEKHERRIMKAVMKNDEGNIEELAYLFSVVTEVKGTDKLVEMIVDETEFPDEWCINFSDVQAVPMRALLKHVSPTRVTLNVEAMEPYSEWLDVLQHLRKVQISLWLDSSSQFEYQSNKRMDQFLHTFLDEEVKTRIDFISGCISNSMLEKALNHDNFRHLVYMKLRIVDFEGLRNILCSPQHLPNFLWMEICLDFDILNEEFQDLPSTCIPLMDVYIQNISDSTVTKLSELLTTIHRSYSGLHLEKSSLTPEGVFTLLIELQKRNVNLYAQPEARERFRRWYYPQLMSVDKSIALNDDTASQLLGFDDRQYYSNHLVESTCFARVLDAWNLNNYLENQSEILHFVYRTDNLSFTKELDGKMRIEVLKEQDLESADLLLTSVLDSQ